MPGNRVGLDNTPLIVAFKEMERRAVSSTDVLPSIAEMLVSKVAEEFETSGQGEWPPFAASTLRGRRGQGSPKLLEDSGTFRDSVHADTGTDYAEAATNCPYAVYHVSEAPRKKLPRRDPFDIDEADAQDEAIDLLYAHMDL
jgi:phage gpG-like protein